MKAIISFLITLSAVSMLVGCSGSPNLSAPCPDFGASCQQSPVNGWDLNQ